MRKQMEGDNQRRRALAREARERGRQPSETGASLSASKQITSLDRGRRTGPPPAGRHKPDTTRGGPAPPPAGTPERPRPQPQPGNPRVATLGYRDLVDDVGRRAGVDFSTAKVGAEATVLTLAWALDEAARQRLLEAVPVKLHDVVPVDGIERHDELPGFLAEVARLSGRSPEQARYQAEATLAALADADGDLVESLRVPDGLRELLAAPEPGGGLVGPASATAPLTDRELREALARLPYWSSDRRSLVRTIELPAGNLDRVLDRLDLLRVDLGRGPQLGRPEPDSAVLTVRTGQVDGVTALDVDLARRIDAVIDEAGAGMAAG
ncbi:4a-hydroxytetrahydrobiopterin dehydratase [Micromonospora mangrovi]|uniref:Putative pterin-4-alpha-carbinolamine dehydratase n=2 Tax=Micromonospora TaxID=1873 RepID=A0AAU8HHJ2_9ACTN